MMVNLKFKNTTSRILIQQMIGILSSGGDTAKYIKNRAFFFLCFMSTLSFGFLLLDLTRMSFHPLCQFNNDLIDVFCHIAL